MYLIIEGKEKIHYAVRSKICLMELDTVAKKLTVHLDNGKTIQSEFKNAEEYQNCLDNLERMTK